MDKSFYVLTRIFNDLENMNPLNNFIGRMTEEEEPKAIGRCKEEKDPEERVKMAFTEGSCAGAVAGFNVGFVYGNMFEVTDPEGKEYVEFLRKKLIQDGTLMFIPKKRIMKVA